MHFGWAAPLSCSVKRSKTMFDRGAGERNRTAIFTLARQHNSHYTTPALVPDPRVELGTPASSGQRSTDELVRRILPFEIWFKIFNEL